MGKSKTNVSLDVDADGWKNGYTINPPSTDKQELQTGSTFVSNTSKCEREVPQTHSNMAQSLNPTNHSR